MSDSVGASGINDDEAVSNFLAFTGCSNADVALSYLEMSGGDLETAVGLYVEHGTSSAATSTTRHQQQQQQNHRMMQEDDDDEDSFLQEDEDPLESNAAWFTGATTENYATRNAHNNNSGSPYIRAPDQTQRMRLMDDDDHNPSRFLRASLLASGMHPPPQQQQQPSAGALFLGEDPEEAAALLGVTGTSIWGSDNNITTATMGALNNFAFDPLLHSTSTSSSTAAGNNSTVLDARAMANAAAAATASETNAERRHVRSTTPPSLQTMFAPPPYIHRGGGFQGARNTAKDARRWLLVNIQSDEDFACHVLNRDIWGDELVANLVQDGFIFWQQTRVSPDGMTYVQRYNVQAFPHVGIIDPRTGRLMWRKEGWTLGQRDAMTPEMFAEIAADFCSRHSFDKPPTAAAKPVKHAATEPIRKRPIEDMTEEEQMEAALKASMNEDIVMLDDDDDDTATDGSMEQQQESNEKKPIKAAEETKNMFQSVHVGEEPCSTAPDVVRIQFRMPDGQRVVRRFRKTDSISMIYAFVYQSLGQEVKEIQLRAGFPPKDLISQLQLGTVESCGLAGGQVVASWK